MKKTIYILLISCLAYISVGAQQAQVPWSQRLSETAMKLWPDSFVLGNSRAAKWSYDQGVILKGIEAVWYATGDVKWFNYLQKCMDYYVQEDGTIKGYKVDEYNIDNLNNGKALLLLYEITGKEKYRKAVQLLRSQLQTHPRSREGGFWHKKVYPFQMWLDGLYMGQPFYAEYARVFHEDSCFNDITNQFRWMEHHARDARTGLLYHGWDESRQQQWADKITGCSPNFWGRALGWYGMALVDALDQFPAKHPGRDTLIGILNRFAKAVTAVQDAQSGLWYDVPNMPTAKGNYKEASASCMLVYTLAKAVRKNYIPANYLTNAKKGYDGIIKEFIRVEDGQANLHGTVSVSGLGGNPYRDGSFDYYMSEKVIVNDPKGMGAFIQCAAEMEMVPTLSVGKGQTVVVDRYFNSEKRNNNGASEYFHYTWEEKSHPGFYAWGKVFEKYGAKLATLDAEPSASNLKNASVYIVVDPDHVKDNPIPNYVTQKDAKTIADWVKSGGMLVMMANDSANCDLEHFNLLAGTFGMHFTNNSRNMVKNDFFETGVVMPDETTIFKGHYKMYLKEISTLDVKAPAKALVTKDGETIIAIAKYGKGTVFAVGDPWLYNEYIDGRKNLPAEFNNHKAANQLAEWLLKQ